MSRGRTIQYAVDLQEGHIISRVGSEIAHPVLDFAAIGQGGHGYAKGDYRGPTMYPLERMPLSALVGIYHLYRWTRKIPMKIKNRHRKFWGMKPLKRKARRVRK